MGWNAGLNCCTEAKPARPVPGQLTTRWSPVNDWRLRGPPDRGGPAKRGGRPGRRLRWPVLFEHRRLCLFHRVCTMLSRSDSVGTTTITDPWWLRVLYVVVGGVGLVFSVALTIVAPAEQGAEVALLASGLVGVMLSLLLLRLGVLPAISLRASEIVVRSGLRTRRADRSVVCGFYAAEGAWGHRLGISLRDGEPICLLYTSDAADE